MNTHVLTAHPPSSVERAALRLGLLLVSWSRRRRHEAYDREAHRRAIEHDAALTLRYENARNAGYLLCGPR